MTQPTNDDDWIRGAESTTAAERFADLLASDAGVYLKDSEEEPFQPFARLVEATSMLPASPEATVQDAAGRCLAMCEPDVCRWMLTGLGKLRITAEAVAEDADHVLATVLAEDFRRTA